MKNKSILEKLPNWLLYLIGLTFGIQIFIAFIAISILDIAVLLRTAVP